jgi:hypothetical protein
MVLSDHGLLVFVFLTILNKLVDNSGGRCGTLEKSPLSEAAN